MTESSTLETSFFALTVFDTPFLAATSNQLITGLGSLWKCRPMWLIESFCFDPTPAARRRKTRLREKYLAPDMNALKNSSSNMLLKSSLCWRNSQN